MPRAAGNRGVRGYQRRAALKLKRERDALEGRPLPDPRPPGHSHRGGAREGAGRPRSVPYALIQRTVERTGASFEEVTALVPGTYLEDPAIITRVREIVEQGQLVFRMTIRQALADKGVKKMSVTALMGLARNTSGLEFD